VQLRPTFAPRGWWRCGAPRYRGIMCLAPFPNAGFPSLAHRTFGSAVFATLTAFRQTAIWGQFRTILQHVPSAKAPLCRTLALDSGMLLASFGKMSLLTPVFVLIVVGVALWLVNSYIPMASSIKAIPNVVVVVTVGVFVLKAAGLWGDVTSFGIGH